MSTITEKIARLLALAESPYEAEAQAEQHQEWGLVMVVPKEVVEKTAAMKTVTYAQPSATAWSPQYANLGYKDGQEFDPAHRLKGDEDQNVARST